MIERGDVEERIAAVNNVRLSAEQIDALFNAERQPVTVRRATARLLRPGIAERAAYDPSPAVRQQALDGWDLPPDTRNRLASDVETNLARLILQGA